MQYWATITAPPTSDSRHLFKCAQVPLVTARGRLCPMLPPSTRNSQLPKAASEWLKAIIQRTGVCYVDEGAT
jgi:hypothetical protein